MIIWEGRKEVDWIRRGKVKGVNFGKKGTENK
jgi:hypothetical protein